MLLSYCFFPFLELHCYSHSSYKIIYLVNCFKLPAAAAAKVRQLCLTLCDPVDCSPPGFSVHGILQARILEWVAMPFPRGIFPIQILNSNTSLAGGFIKTLRLTKIQSIFPLVGEKRLFPTINMLGATSQRLFDELHLRNAWVLSRFSHVWLFRTPSTIAHQAPLSMEFSRQEYWNGLPFPSPGELPNPVIEPMSLMSAALAGRFFTTSSTWGVPLRNELLFNIYVQKKKKKSKPEVWEKGEKNRET